MAATKPEFMPAFQQLDTHYIGHQKKLGTARLVESVRLGLTVLALLAGITILGTSVDTLNVYNETHLGEDFFLPLWPSEFDIRPTAALVICSAIIFLASAASLLASKVPAARSRPFIHSSVSFLAPTVCLIAGLVSISFFYGVNASNTVSTLKSWSCQWSAISMNVQPHWDTLCMESKTALYLMVMVIPVEVLVLGTAAWGAFAEKQHLVVRERKGSPAMS